MSRWQAGVGPAVQPATVGSVPVERQLLDRLEAMRNTLIDHAHSAGWDVVAVDTILHAGGLPTWTREYEVTFSEVSQHKVTVRAVDTAQAAEFVALKDDQHLVTVREVR